MIAEYTETLKDYLDNKGGDFPTPIKNLLVQIPNFVFKDEDMGIDIELTFIDLFKDKYDIREICAETEELFEHFLTETAQHCLIDYVPKIHMWLKNFKELFKFTVNLEYGYTNGKSGSYTTDNTYYLNPVNKLTQTRDNLKVQDVDSTENTSSNSEEVIGSKDVLQTVWGKTRANILDQIMNLKNIYTDCLEYFQRCFMGIY